MSQPEIPGVGPIERSVWSPAEWLTTTGIIFWSPYERPGRCDDCLMCIVEFLNGEAPAGTLPPGLARPATWSRRQARKRHIFCEGHTELRREEEGSRDD